MVMSQRCMEMIERHLEDMVALKKMGGMSDDDAKVASLMTLERLSRVPRMADKVSEFYINSLLSGLGTQAVNASSGLIQGPANAAARTMTGMWWDTLRILTGNDFLGEASTREGLSMLPALFQVWKEARGYAGQAWKGNFPSQIYNDVTDFLPEAIGRGKLKWENRIPVDIIDSTAAEKIFGKIVRFPTRMNVAADEFWRTAYRRMETNALLHRYAPILAKKHGRPVNEMYQSLNRAVFEGQGPWWERLKQLADGNSDMKEILQRANNFQDKLSFREELPGLWRTTQKALNRHPVAKILVAPFFKTPVNIAKESLAYNPIYGVIKTAKIGRQRIKGMPTEEFGEDFIAKQLLGGALWAGVMTTDSIEITGDYSANAAERQIQRESGFMPYTMRIGNLAVEYRRLEPLSTILGFVADAKQAMKDARLDQAESMRLGKLVDLDGKELEESVGDWIATRINAVAVAAAKNLSNKTYLQQLTLLGNMMTDPDRYGGSSTSRMIANAVVPGILGQTARAADPYERELLSGEEGGGAWADETLRRIQNRIPGEMLGVGREALPARYGRTGDGPTPNVVPVPIVPQLVGGGGEPTPQQEYLTKIKFDKSTPSKSIGEYKLTNEEYSRLQQYIQAAHGDKFKNFIDKLEQSNVPDQRAKYLIERYSDKMAEIGKERFISDLIKEKPEVIQYIKMSKLRRKGF